jgi:hypothetical protein
MTQSTRFCLGAFALSLALASFAGCGGGGTTVTPNPGTIDTGNNQVPDLILNGPPQYDGQDGPAPPPLPGPGTGGSVPDKPPFIYENIFSVPISSNGQGQVVASTLTTDGTGRLGFLPGQKVAMIILNVNPNFLDLHYDEAAQTITREPASAYSFTADLVARGSASMASWDRIQQQTREDLGQTEAYNGLYSPSGTVSPSVIYEREAISQGLTPYAVQPATKQASVIQKGEIRTFVNVPPTIPPPPIVAGPETPDRPVDELSYPFEYSNSQDGRLVAIGARCLIFLSREINDGKPDTIRFTEARLAAMAREFDTKIFPTTQAAFGKITNFDEPNIFRDLDRSIVLTGDDFDQADPPMLTTPLPSTVDLNISQEQKMIIFLFNSGGGGGGGFYVGGLSEASRQKLADEGRDDEIEAFAEEGSTLYIDANNLPANDDSWTAAYSVLAHEFQHKCYHDNDMPERATDPTVGSNYNWLNEGLSMMSIHVNGYTVNSGEIVDWAINGQLTSYLNNINRAPIPVDSHSQISNQNQYGGGFLFFLYLYEHYDPGVGNRIYAAHKAGEEDFIKLIEAGAQQTVDDIGPDGQAGTTDDSRQIFHDTFEELYAKYAIANFIDGIYQANSNALFDPRFHYNTIDLRGTVNLASGTIVLPGVRTGVYPQGGTYPVTDIHREVWPWAMDYVVFTNGDGRDLSLRTYTDRFMRMFMLPVNYNASQNVASIVEGVTIPTQPQPQQP